jgi:quinoprotein relay system zinc metallohydrolase 2
MTIAAVLAAFALAPPAAAIAADPLPLSEIASGIFIHQGAYEDVNAKNGGDIANVGFVVGEKAVAVIDTGNTLAVGERLRAAVKAKTNLPILFVVTTHGHPDHYFGDAAFKPDKPQFVGHEKLARWIAFKTPYYIETLKTFVGPDAAQGIEAIPPAVTVKTGQSIELDLGGRTLTVTAWPAAHTDNDVTVLDSKTKSLWTGDLLFVDRVPSLDGTILGWLKVISELKKIPAARAVPGHGPATVDWPGALAGEERYLNALVSDIRKIQAAHGKLEEATQKAGLEERDKWALFDDYNPRNVTAAFVELEWE